MRNIKKRGLNLNPGDLGKGSDCKVMTGRPSYLYDVKTICEICSRSKVKVLFIQIRGTLIYLHLLIYPLLNKQSMILDLIGSYIYKAAEIYLHPVLFTPKSNV